MMNTNLAAHNSKEGLVNESGFLAFYDTVRKKTEEICSPLKTEDYVLQPVEYVSPPKWHLGHTTWFFESMLLIHYFKPYKVFNDTYNFIFNSYYETIGARVIRTDRGNLSRPTVEEVYQYRKHVDEAMAIFLRQPITDEVKSILILGLNHEQQHQELLCSDIKFILGHNPLFPALHQAEHEKSSVTYFKHWIDINSGLYDIGYQGDGFCFDNEMKAHKTYLNDFSIANQLVTNSDYIIFMASGGYENFKYWHSDGWEWKKQNDIKAPLYWYKIDKEWHYYTLGGLKKVQLHEPVTHVSFYEAYAFANWLGCRLPTESEWEIASSHFKWGKRWEWTNSAYLPYAGFKTAEGALGEYNGKFMVNQMVLKGASEFTAKSHSRKTYRNFFQPHLQWQFSGIRLVK